MFCKRAAGGILAAGLIAGCQQSHTPKASAPIEPMNQSTVAGLEQSWRASHPGTEVGVVNAVLPASRLVSAADLPIGQIQEGNVVSILEGQNAGNLIPAVVIGKNHGFLQLRYSALQPGQRDPQPGDLAVWISGSQPVVPSAVAPANLQPTTAPAVVPGAIPPEPATRPAEMKPEATTPANVTPSAGPETGAQPTTMPASQPAEMKPEATTPTSANVEAPATRPAEPGAQPGAMPATQPAGSAEGQAPAPAATEPAASQPAGTPSAPSATETPSNPTPQPTPADLNK